LPVIAGQGTRPGTAVPEKDGFRLSGSWSFASGIKHGTHIHTLGIIQGTGEPRIFVLPVEQVQLIDNWDVMGLRATGSIDYKIDSVRARGVHALRHHRDAEARRLPLYDGHHRLRRDVPHGMGVRIGRRLLDELAANVRARGGRAGTQSTSESFLEGYAAARGHVSRRARVRLRDVARRARHARARSAAVVRQNTLIRLGIAHVTWACHDVASFVYKSAGTTGLRAGTIQRLFRDMNAGTQHVVASPPVFRALGRELAGLAEGQKWRFLELVDAKG
jgi:hypothetical protein